MIKLRPHGNYPDDWTFESRAAMFAFEKINRWEHDEGFHRWSLGTETLHETGARAALLMAEFDGGKRWYVVGYVLDGIAELDLPNWTGGR